MNPSSSQAPPTPPFMAGAGEAATLMRRVDWSQTGVGPVDGWPASLRTTVGLLLGSRHPMFLFWGDDHVCFYNDAYLPSFGVGKHPKAMGQRGVDCWEEIWPVIWPQIDDVRSRGIASFNEDQLIPIIRNGHLEEVYWTYGYSPVYGDTGSIDGTLVVCTETTARVVTQRRLHSLQKLSDALLPAVDTAALLGLAADQLGGSTTGDIAFVMVYSGGTQPRLIRSNGITPSAEKVLDHALAGRLVRLAELGAPTPMPHGLAVPGRPWPEDVAEFYVTASGPGAAAAYFVFGLSPRLAFDTPYREYLDQLAEHVATSRGRILAFEARATIEGERNNLLEQAPIPTAILVGTELVFSLANPAYCEMIGRDDLVGRPLLECFPEVKDTPSHAVLNRVMAEGVPYVNPEMRVEYDRDATGTLKPAYFRYAIQPIRDANDAVFGMMVAAVDITEQVTARLALEANHREREQLVRELEAASSAKDQFLAMLGHELRNPLSPMLTALQLLKRRDIPGIDTERDIIERQLNHMVRLVDDLLDVSRIVRGLLELDRERVSLTSVVARAIEQASPLIDQRRHHLHHDVPEDLVVVGDPGRLAQVVANLLTNAAKYTPSGGEILVEGRLEGDAAELTVRDNGCGISEAVLPTLFDAFARAHADPGTSGLGLGLTIVKNLVDAHGGSVAITSDGVGLGTTCTVRLPLAGAGAPSDADSGSADDEVTGEGCRVLIVDDNRDAADLLGMALGLKGHEVEVVYDAAEALRLAETSVPDVALLDLGMPVMDGYVLAEQLRKLEGWSDVRLMALTGYGQQSDIERTRAAGFAVHLVKPIDFDVVDAHLTGRASGDD